jgi:hypothetical protein
VQDAAVAPEMKQGARKLSHLNHSFSKRNDVHMSFVWGRFVKICLHTNFCDCLWHGLFVSSDWIQNKELKSILLSPLMRCLHNPTDSSENY